MGKSKQDRYKSRRSFAAESLRARPSVKFAHKCEARGGARNEMQEFLQDAEFAHEEEEELREEF